MKLTTTLALATLAAGTLYGSIAAADDAGNSGRVVALQLNGTGSDAQALYAGRITIRTNKSKDEYMWGGSTCPGQKLSDTQVQVLAAAMRARTTITPMYKIGEGATQRCLVAFELRV